MSEFIYPLESYTEGFALAVRMVEAAVKSKTPELELAVARAITVYSSPPMMLAPTPVEEGEG